MFWFNLKLQWSFVIVVNSQGILSVIQYRLKAGAKVMTKCNIL
jgi:hypothetical protein